jgi:hypothetical protein
VINKTSNDEIAKNKSIKKRKKNESTMLTRHIYDLIHEARMTSIKKIEINYSAQSTINQIL